MYAVLPLRSVEISTAEWMFVRTARDSLKLTVVVVDALVMLKNGVATTTLSAVRLVRVMEREPEAVAG